MKPKKKIFTDPDGKRVATIFIRVYGIPIWIESKNVKELRKNIKRSKRFTKYAEKANAQLQKFKQLPAEILND